MKSTDDKLAFFLCAVFAVAGLVMLAWAFKLVWNDRPYKVPAGYKLVPVNSKEKKAAAKSEVLKYDLGEMFIKGSKEAAAGQAIFAAKNIGAAPHELVILKTDKPADSLGSGATVPEPGKVGEIVNIAAGQTKKGQVKLQKGHYALICNIPGHYAAGMHQDLNVN